MSNLKLPSSLMSIRFSFILTLMLSPQGLANQKFDSNKLLTESIKFAEQIAQMSPYAISASKAVINKANEQSAQENIRLAQVWSALIAAQKEANDSSPPSHPLGK